ncbi:MAG: carboxypeptidase regulatory-like domain-containing protein, partial [Desulfobacteria bacterium]
MSKRLLVLMCSIFLIVPLLFMGCGSGSDGSNGAPGTSAPTTGTVAGTVTDAVAGDGIAGVTVTAKNSGGATLGSATTDGSGNYTLAALPLGTVTVYFAQTYYTSPGGMMVGVLGGQTVTINAALSESATGGPSVSITGYNSGMYTTDDFGYGGTAALAASGSDPNGDTLTYAWSNATSPALGSVSGAGTTATVTFPTLAAAMAQRADTANNATISGYDYLSGRFGILPILADTRGAVSTKVTVTDGRGKSASVTLALNAASVLTGARNVPKGARVYMNRGNDNASETWAITAKPAGSAAALDNASSRTASFVADVSGQYTLTAGANTITLNAGTWTGIIDSAGATTTGYTVGQEGACRTCHNDTVAVNEFDDWYATGHSRIFTLGVTGGSGSSSVSCLNCHTVGFDRGTNNDGFDDYASLTGWVFPTRNATAWTSMVTNYPTVAKRANIQCENCHGPQASPGHMSTGPLGAIDNNNTFASDRISYSAELCATCHASGAGHNIYSQWSALSPDGMGHANRSRAIASGTSAHCGRCHSAQGFTVYVDQLEAGVVGSIDNVTVPAGAKFLSSVKPANVESVTCTACHDPHDATNPNQLRVFGDTAMLPSGFQMTGVGKGAICITCHNSRNGGLTSTTTYLHEDGQINPTGYSAPHQACQGDVFAGRNAYFLGTGSLPMISRHAAIEDTCVGCHMALNPKTHLSHGSVAVDSHRFRIDAADLGTLCSNCHGAGTVNGEGIQASI